MKTSMKFVLGMILMTPGSFILTGMLIQKLSEMVGIDPLTVLVTISLSGLGLMYLGRKAGG